MLIKNIFNRTRPSCAESWAIGVPNQDDVCFFSIETTSLSLVKGRKGLWFANTISKHTGCSSMHIQRLPWVLDRMPYIQLFHHPFLFSSNLNIVGLEDLSVFFLAGRDFQRHCFHPGQHGGAGHEERERMGRCRFDTWPQAQFAGREAAPLGSDDWWESGWKGGAGALLQWGRVEFFFCVDGGMPNIWKTKTNHVETAETKTLPNQHW